ncbi:hypothetical protein ASD16_03025 [Cellulomonas sp. Root485]|uniref:hypothetical protein n=1 Tax=Cellulomonas sp. Root485 TaxID=1736546 RepID=UPI0006F7D569|nr:hypothetical protein [Cellulomonas sp. Root485]KQY24518.1 hypothetical protein ASD16_03025 [Cellulomonas sp. Root485]
MSLPPDEHPPGLVLDARLHLLDRQVLDVDGVPVCTVDDLEVHGVDGSDLPDGTQTAFVTSLLSGAVLATRVFGGRPPSSRWHRIRWTHVADVGTTVALGVRGDTLDVTWTERWVRDRVIGRLPGGRHDPG